jgi:RHS repeat-associated protein
MRATYTSGLWRADGGTDRFCHSDWLASVRYFSDSSGNSFPSALRYDGFGNRCATGGTDPYDPSDFQFAGGAGYQTEFASATDPGLGLQLLQQRYCDSAAGRFLSPDPIGFAGGINRYTYAQNDPVGRVDPSGERDCLAETVKGAQLGFGAGLAASAVADVATGGTALVVNPVAVVGCVGQEIASNLTTDSQQTDQDPNYHPPEKLTEEQAKELLGSDVASPGQDDQTPVRIYRGMLPQQVQELQATGGTLVTPPPPHDPTLYVATDPNFGPVYAGIYNPVWTTVPKSEFNRAFFFYGRYAGTESEEIVLPWYERPYFPDFFTGWTPMSR